MNNYPVSKHSLGLPMFVFFGKNQPSRSYISGYLARTEIMEFFSDTVVGQPSRRVWTCLRGDGRGEAA
jgi:hypothetical protein